MKNTPTPDEQIEMHGRMVAVRHLEERLGELHKAGKTRGPIHRCDGQEAVGIGATAVLRRQDKLASTHRGHGHSIAKGCDVDAMMLEIFGKQGGLCKGKGGSMHIADLDKGMMGANGIVGGGPPLICGAALSAKHRGTGGIAIAFVGDGGSNQGTTFEAMNLASVGPLACLWLEWRGGRAGQQPEMPRTSPDLPPLASRVAVRLASWTVISFLVGAALGLMLIWLAWRIDGGAFRALERIPRNAYTFAAMELVFSGLCLALYAWLAKRKLPEQFVCGTECELRELGEEGGVVRCRGVDLFSEEVDTHLQAGRQVVRLTLGWDERLSLQLGEDLCLRRLKFADQLMKENDSIDEDDRAARFDADFALMADAVSALQARLLDVFGGEAG